MEPSLRTTRRSRPLRLTADEMHAIARQQREFVNESEEPGSSEEHALELRSSFIDLYRTQFAATVRLAVALTGSDLTAEDIVHDVFVRVHAKWARIENPKAYLRASVVNACRSSARREARERAALSKGRAGVTTLAPDEMFDALAALPHRQRAALVLYFYEGLHHREIAEVLGCREGTVASLIHRGLAQLRRVIEQ